MVQAVVDPGDVASKTLIRPHIFQYVFNSRLIRNLLFWGEAHVNLWNDMKTRWDKMLPSEPRWDGDRLTFTINTEGKRIPCAISRSALWNLSGHTHVATRDLPDRFMDSRDRIEEIAARIFHVTPEWVSGPISIWADDIDNPPPVRGLCPREVIPSPPMVRSQLVREQSRHPDVIR